jgi:predicted HicB family RNase H-like nuclease
MKNLPVRLSEELHRALKVKCASEGKTMNEVITELIEVYVKGSKPKTKK